MSLTNLTRAMRKVRSLSLPSDLLRPKEITTAHNRKKGNQCADPPEVKCEPKIPVACPKCCEIKRPKKVACTIPVQPPWPDDCDRLCLPCCKPICIPLSCESLEVKLNCCKKEEYRLPSYSECNKDYIHPKQMKECCYFDQACQMGSIAGKELKCRVKIKARQKMVLQGFRR